ncbi:cytochrome P450 6a2-like [Homalodisca vitripennis]|uniref:cytochrome P450 6a2-like n=1 Tax=Homalodisca vitripennis TaxID=197043 RepID=UPI001EEC50BF|nr:cytochrome P450 6a2-like [Homalodisca vitripennis]
MGIVFFCLSILLSMLLFLYWYLTYDYKYWKARGVPYIEPSFPFGNLGDVILGRKSLIDLVVEQYKQFEGERFFGIFHLNKPILVLRDSSLVERIMVKDFSYFCDRGQGTTVNNHILGSYLGNLKGSTWRQMRQKLNGAFSQSKLKQMSERISICSDSLIESIEDYRMKEEPVKLDSLGIKFIQRVIASCSFGIECDEDGLQDFVRNVNKVFLKMRIVNLIILWDMYIPQLTKLLYFIPAVAEVVDYFRNLSSTTIQVRKSTQRKGNDFLQILLDLGGEEEETDNETYCSHLSGQNDPQSNSPSEKMQGLYEHCITSQMFIFMSFGLDLVSNIICFILFDLASNSAIQQRVHQEIDVVVKKYGHLNFTTLQKLNYLESVIQESLRIKSGFGYTTRVCQVPYHIPDSDLVVEKGVSVMIPTCAIHLDSQNHLDPEQFIPDRFSDNHFKSGGTYLPFGMGPRMCVASNLVILQLKIAVATVMSNYTLRLNKKTSLPLQYAPMFMPSLLTEVWVDFEQRTPE